MNAQETELTTWLTTNNYFTRTKEAPNPSHLLYNGYKGGKLYIPRNKDYEFLSKYANELTLGTKLYYVETRPKTFKFMIDIDLTDDHYWTDQELIPLIQLIQKTIYEFFETDQSVICCTSPLKIKPDGVHTGVHLIWPSIFVISDTALLLRRGIIQRLKEVYTNVKKSWEDVIDETIYTRNGYRMVGSDKMNRLKTPENRPLSLLFVIDSHPNYAPNKNYTEILSTNTKRLVLETSIRLVIDAYIDQGMNVNKVPPWVEIDALQKRVGYKVTGNVVSGKEHLVIENFIRKFLPKEYRNTVKSVVRYPKEENYPHALLIKSSSRYCMNIGRNHNSCGIYFYATPEGITQKCLCSCNKMDNRKTGLCMDFTSGLYPFDDATRNILFPELDRNLFETQSKKKELLKKKQQRESTKFQPSTKESRVTALKKICDQMLEGITKEKVGSGSGYY